MILRLPDSPFVCDALVPLLSDVITYYDSGATHLLRTRIWSKSDVEMRMRTVTRGDSDSRVS